MLLYLSCFDYISGLLKLYMYNYIISILYNYSSLRTYRILTRQIHIMNKANFNMSIKV